jgi:hypothetical protein
LTVRRLAFLVDAGFSDSLLVCAACLYMDILRAFSAIYECPATAWERLLIPATIASIA